MKNQTIGVEIEMTGITRQAAAQVVAEYFGTTANYVGGGYDAYEVEDNGGRIWKIMYDSSIKAKKKVSDGEIDTLTDSQAHIYKVELVTPILNYIDIETLQEVVRTVRKAGAVVNQSCGMHIHIGAKDFTAKQLRTLLNFVASREEIFYAALNVYESRKRYCKPADRRIIREINQKKPVTLEQFKNVWYNGVPSKSKQHYDLSRYTICNLHAFFSKGTIEFRIFNSTLHAGEVKAAIQFCLGLTHTAKTAAYAVYNPRLDKFEHRMKLILAHIGLTGEEFKTARYHLLKHLKNVSNISAVA